MLRHEAQPAAQGICAGILAKASTWLLRMDETWRQRRQLDVLSDWQLRDIGLSRADVEAEAAQPFWRV
ncbi:MAG: DUF1127 domain-containing protein [Rhodospirillaceae bacterium]|nr:DUF1127 domain-containing protein [Rhodospirillaceae bacterium]